ncbi:MAG TPA: hypothetical protein VNF69_05630 [Burkholderiales bacterium]|nr:hypothetical protein [Burkholderiales bacterium]
MNALPGFGRAAPGFDAPLELLAAALGVMRYFDMAGAKHHQDEEEDLFPVLRVHAAGQGACWRRLKNCNATTT